MSADSQRQVLAFHRRARDTPRSCCVFQSQTEDIARGLAAGKRLLAVRIVPLDNFTHLAVVLCQPPNEP